jgi:hypothetical protein
MGSSCCSNILTKRAESTLLRNREDQHTQISHLLYFYKTNKPFMPKKLLPIYKQLCKTGSFSSDILNLNFTPLQKPRSSYLFQLLPFLCHLTVLKLWKSSLGTEGMKDVYKPLSLLSRLEVLSLEDNGLGPDGFFYVAKAVRRMKRLKELWLHINDAGVVGATYLAGALEELEGLEQLGLDENDMENTGAFKV